MKIKLPKFADYSSWECYPETDRELEVLKEMCPDDYDPQNPWKIGDGPFSFGLEDLHILTQKNVTLRGLPSWLIIR